MKFHIKLALKELNTVKEEVAEQKEESRLPRALEMRTALDTPHRGLAHRGLDDYEFLRSLETHANATLCQNLTLCYLGKFFFGLK